MKRQLEADLVGRLRMQVVARHHLGETPLGGRRIDFLGDGGSFEGPRLRAQVKGGIDHMLRTGDGTMRPDVKVVLATAQGELVYLTYTGTMVGPRDVTQAAWEGRPTDPSAYTLRTTAVFETAATDYLWLNTAVCVGYGERYTKDDGTVGIQFDFYALL